ncbi:hypothetical protein [Nosocomiicoccus ampullae]|uniref:hypothetical protein n=1 Tax=Nosocomiicoccus ampullae TaxID=489910 RepID=UPI001C601592|nr:hypothetical protein [Nosocomiicoccus ampullae]QYA48664.1 hypothetical protein KPF52_01035 [Nosocomiicoccus ampullae]
MKRFLVALFLTVFLVACTTSQNDDEKTIDIEEKNSEQKEEKQTLKKTRYIISFSEPVTIEVLEKYGIKESDVVNEMDNLNMKTIDLDENQYEKIKDASFVSHIEEDEAVGVPPGEKEDKSDEM